MGRRGARHPHPSPPRKGEGTSDAFTLLELRPITGRTHQLRVHCAALGFPILGDPIYGNAPRAGGPGLHLHARAVTVPLYPKKPPIGVEAPVPERMQEMVEACRPQAASSSSPVVAGDGDLADLAGADRGGEAHRG